MRSFRGESIRMVLGLVASLVAMSGLRAEPATLQVTMDKALILKYPAGTESIVVGNPVIADITMIRNSGIVVLTGKGYGDTNLVFLDRGGKLLAESNVRVQPPTAVVYVQRGMDRDSYSCHPRCNPTVVLGDEAPGFGALLGQIKSRNGAVDSGGGGGGAQSMPH